MLITMYTKEPLPLSIRSEFDPVCWAYSEHPEDIEDFKNYMKSLTCFRYDDSDQNIEGRDVSYALHFDVVKDQVVPFDAYISSVYVDDDFRPIKWPNHDQPNDPLIKKLLRNPVSKDLLAWTHWNAKVEVEFYTEDTIKRRVQEELLDPELIHHGKCWEPDPLGIQKK